MMVVDSKTPRGGTRPSGESFIAGTTIIDPSTLPPRPTIEVTAEAPRRNGAGATPQDLSYLAAVGNLAPSLAAVLRPQAAYRWLLPYLASITPQYVESILRGALAGNHVQAWELFDLMCDTNPEIRSCIGEYTDGICSKKLIVEPYCDEDAEPTPNAIQNQKIVSAALRNMKPDPANDENSLAGTIRDLIFSRFHGQSVLEMDYYDTYGTGQLNRMTVAGVGNIVTPRCTFWVHPVCYAWSMEGRLGLRVALSNQIQEITQTAKNRFENGAGSGRRGTPPSEIGSMVEPPAWNWMSSQPMPSYLQEFPAHKFLISIFKGKAGTALSGCDLRPLAIWWVFENFAADYSMDNAQLFGIPLRTAYYDTETSETDKAFVREMLQQMGSRGWALLPDSVKLEFEKQMAGGAETPAGFLIKLCQEQYRKVILRQTMTGSGHGGAASGSKAGMRTEQDVKAVCIQSGADFVAEDGLRQQFARHVVMVNKGNDKELPIIKLAEVEEGSLENMQRDQIGATLIDLGENYFRKKYNYPRPAPGEALAKAAAPAAPPKPASDTTDSGELDPDQELNAQTVLEPRITRIATLEQVRKNSRMSREERERKTKMELEAGEISPESPVQSPKSELQQRLAEELHASIKPVLVRLEKISKIEDADSQQAAIEKLIKDFPALQEAIEADGSGAKHLAPALLKSFAEGVNAKAVR